MLPRLTPVRRRLKQTTPIAAPTTLIAGIPGGLLLLRDQLLNTENRKLRQDLRWMVFKVKKRAATDYSRFVKKGLIDDTSEIVSNTLDAKYSYNWPYDYFSLVELVKIDEAIEYTSTLPPDSRIEIVGDVNIRAPNGIVITEEEDVFEDLED